MRIGLFDPYLDTLSGGEKYMLTIASCLSKDNEVYIFWDLDKEKEIKEKALSKLGLDLSKINFYKNIFSKEESLLSRLSESSKFDVIFHLSDGAIPFVATKLFVHFQFPVEWIKGDSIKNKIKLAFVKKIFCNSYFTKKYIDKKLNINSEVIYPPIAINTNDKLKKEKIILHVGRFAESEDLVNYKKQDLMIENFKKIIDEGLRGWKFVLIIGVREEDKGKTARLKNLVKNYPIEIIENPTNDTLWSYYSKSKIYWHASGYGEDLDENPERAEHFGMSTVEAMGAGAVPVVINAGGQKEIVENGKDGFLWNGTEELINQTKKLIDNEKLWLKLSNNAKKKALIFGKDRFCKDIDALLK